MLKIICSLQKYSDSRLTAVTVIFVLGMLFRKTLARMMRIEVKFIDKYAFFLNLASAFAWIRGNSSKVQFSHIGIGSFV